MITKEQIKIEIDSLETQQKAMADFFGMHKDLGIESVEEELRLIRKGRRRLWDDI